MTVAAQSVAAPVDGDYILETRGLCKQFGGFSAVANIDLKVQRGRIHVLIGPNGAGKTTCFNLLTKTFPTTSGAIYFDGREITRLQPADVAILGMVRSFQISAIFPTLTVIDNLRVALQRPRGLSFKLFKPEAALNVLNDRAYALLDDVGLKSFANRQAGELSYGRKRALEIATTLSLDPQLVLLDEPTSGMGVEDVGRIANLIERIAQTKTILMVEHNLGVVARLADRVTVLAQGQVLAEGSYDDVSANESVIAAYIGKKRHG